MAEKPATILIVDDAEAARYAVSRILQKADYSVLEARTGMEALRLMERRPDLVVLDINLPDMSGHEVCRRIKDDPATAPTPVLHLSASFVESENRSEGLEMGADGYLTYPLEPRELIANVQALLRMRQAERDARAQRSLLFVTLHSIGDGVVATDENGIITFINPTAQALTAWPESEAVGKVLADVFRIVNEETGEPVDNPVETVLRTGQMTGLSNHTVLIARDGTRRPIDDTAAPIRDDEGRFRGIVLVFHDISDRRRMERELQRQAEDLAELDRRKDDFLALLGHELRNPLAPIRNAVGLLELRGDDPEVVAQARDIIDRQTSQMTRLVDELLDASRIARGKVQLRRERLDLAALTRTTIEDQRPDLESAGLSLTLEAPPTPLWVNGDPVRLVQIVGNLLHNASKFTERGGRVTVRVQGGAEDVTVSVEDNGIGIPGEALPKLFEAFNQATAGLQHTAGGLGLGLAVVRGLVELHGGGVQVASEGTGRGAVFSFTLPLALAPTAAATGGDAIPVPSDGRRTVLVVEDGRDAAESLRMLLTLRGFEVKVARTGPQGVELARRLLPDAVVCDLGLPGLTGFEVARALRADPATAGMLLISMSGYGQEQDRQQAHEAGFDAVTVKPADIDALVRLLVRPREQQASNAKETV